jgi:hypothetical protein
MLILTIYKVGVNGGQESRSINGDRVTSLSKKKPRWSLKMFACTAQSAYVSQFYRRDCAGSPSEGEDERKSLQSRNVSPSA